MAARSAEPPTGAPTVRHDGAAARPPAPLPPGCHPADVWRREHTVRKSHWLCRTCDIAVPRDEPECSTCHCSNFSQSDLRAEDAARLAHRLRACPALRSLDVSHNGIGASGVASLAAALPMLASLTRLDLSATCASDDGAIALVDALAAHATCPHLHELSLIGCAVKDRGGAAFARLLASGTPPLTHLGLGYNQIRADAARALAHAAVRAPRLVRFNGLPIATLREGQLPPVPPLSERDPDSPEHGEAVP